MYRGTTPTLTLVMPENINNENVTALLWSFEQNGTIIVEKKLNDMTVSGSRFTVKLTQTEANLFDANKELITQARYKLSDDTVGAIKEIKLRVNAVLNDEEI